MDWWLGLKQATHFIVKPLSYAVWNAIGINQLNGGRTMTLSHLHYVVS